MRQHCPTPTISKNEHEVQCVSSCCEKHHYKKPISYYDCYNE